MQICHCCWCCYCFRTRALASLSKTDQLLFIRTDFPLINCARTKLWRSNYYFRFDDFGEIKVNKRYSYRTFSVQWTQRGANTASSALHRRGRFCGSANVNGRFARRVGKAVRFNFNPRAWKNKNATRTDPFRTGTRGGNVTVFFFLDFWNLILGKKLQSRR